MLEDSCLLPPQNTFWICWCFIFCNPHFYGKPSMHHNPTNETVIGAVQPAPCHFAPCLHLIFSTWVKLRRYCPLTEYCLNGYTTQQPHLKTFLTACTFLQYNFCHSWVCNPTVPAFWDNGHMPGWTQRLSFLRETSHINLVIMAFFNNSGFLSPKPPYLFGFHTCCQAIEGTFLYVVYASHKKLLHRAPTWVVTSWGMVKVRAPKR